MTGSGAILATATAAKTGSTTTAVIDGETVTIQVARDLTVATGDVMLVHRVGAQWFAASRHFTAAPAAVENTPTPPVKPVTVYGRLIVSPVETRSYRTGRWRTDNDDVYQGQYGGNGNHTGCAFFGSKPRSLTGATVTSASIKVRRQAGGAYAPQGTTMRLVTQSTRPGGAPTLTSTTSGPSLAVAATSNSFTVPTAWVQAMVDGTAGGIAFFDSSGSPYVVFSGRGSWSAAFTLTINWQRG